jgi:c-di-GMP-binding flagellar brake protein YcgR
VEEQRKAERKLVKAKVMVKLEGGETIMGRTFDLGTSGVGVLLDVPLKIALQVRISVGLLINDAVIPMHSQARVQYCIFSSGEYRMGLQFLQIDAAMATMLAKFLR